MGKERREKIELRVVQLSQRLQEGSARPAAEQEQGWDGAGVVGAQPGGQQGPGGSGWVWGAS